MNKLIETILFLIVLTFTYIVWVIFFMPLTVIYKIFNGDDLLKPTTQQSLDGGKE